MCGIVDSPVESALSVTIKTMGNHSVPLPSDYSCPAPTELVSVGALFEAQVILTTVSLSVSSDKV